MKIPPHRRLWLPLVLVVACVLGAAGARAQTAAQLYEQGVQAYNLGEVDQAKRKLQLTLEVDKNFRPASALLNRINLEQKTAGGAAPAAVVPVKTLDKTVVPVEFKDTSLDSALEYIKQHIATVSGGKMQVNFVLNVPPELAKKRVTLQLDHVPVTELLRYLGQLAGVNFEMQKYAILVTPANGGGSVQPGGAAAPALPAPTP